MKKIYFLFVLVASLVTAQEFKQYSQKCVDGKERPFVVYSPKSEVVKGNALKPLLVFLHGAVSQPELKKDPVDYAKKSQLVELADKGNFLVLFVYGQNGATWFDKVGSQMILDEIETVATKYPIDKNKVFLSGFSDGASGTYYMSMVYPNAFAGFISLNGSLKIADNLGEESMYPANAMPKSFYIINTVDDMLYPMQQMKDAVDYMQTFVPEVQFSSPTGNHSMEYLEEKSSEILSFIAKNERKPSLKLSFETDNLKPNRRDWILVNQLDTISQPADWHKPYEGKVRNNKANFNVNFNFVEGEGLKVISLKGKNGTGSKLGLEPNDIVLKMENDSIKSGFTPYAYVAKKQAGEPTELTIKRNGEVMVLKGKFNDGYDYLVFNNKKKSGKIEAEIVGDTIVVRTSRIKDFEIDFTKIPQKIKFVELNGNKMTRKQFLKRK